MRFSFWPNLSQSWTDVLEGVKHAEATGWHGVYVADHFMGDGGGFGPETMPMHESTAVLAALATATERVRLGSLVLGVTYRRPAVLASWASTVDHISGGRLTLGLGAGWQLNEHEQYGIPLGTPGVRVDRLEEALAVIRGLLTDETTTFVGDHYRLTEARSEPKAVQSPLPILVGGKGDRMMGVVARHADAWNMWSTAPVFAERSAALDAACEREGRDPSTIARTTQALWFPGDDAEADRAIEAVAPRAAIGGSVERMREAVGAWAEAGVDEVIVPDFTLGTGSRRADALDLIAEQVAHDLR